MKYAISFKPAKCLGCRSCEIECAVAHSKAEDLIEALKERSSVFPQVTVEECGGWAVPLRCAHCEAAPCVAVCPAGAISKKGDDELIVIDQNMCIGCGSCTIVCPYGVLLASKDGKVLIKCDLCVERLEKGELPACVVGCPTGALEFVEVSEIEEGKGVMATFKKEEQEESEPDTNR